MLNPIHSNKFENHLLYYKMEYNENSISIHLLVDQLIRFFQIRAVLFSFHFPSGYNESSATVLQKSTILYKTD